METHSQPARDMGYTPTPPPDMNTTTSGQGKKGIAEKVKGLIGGHAGHKTDAAHHQQQTQTPVYGDATATTGNAESTRVGCLDKIKAKAGVGHGHAPEQARAAHGTAGQGFNADPSSSPDFNGGMNVNSSAAVHGGWPHPTNPNQNAPGAYGEPRHNHGVGNPNQAMAGGYGDPQPMNPTGMGNPNQAMAGNYGDPQPVNTTGMGNRNQAMAGNYGDQQSMNTTGMGNPNQAMAGNYGDPQSMNTTGMGNRNQAMAGNYGDPQPMNTTGMGNPNQAMAGGYGDPQPTNPTGVTNSQGGAVLGDHHGNVHEGPRDDDVKKEGFMSKIMDKLHSPKGKPAHTATSTTPTSY